MGQMKPEETTENTESADRRIPSRIKIGAYEYSVVVSNAAVALHASGGDKVDGICSHYEQKIYVREDAAVPYMRWLLMHECLHGVFTHGGFNDGHGKKLGEEDAINLICGGIVQMLRDNPLFVDFITADPAE